MRGIVDSNSSSSKSVLDGLPPNPPPSNPPPPPPKSPPRLPASNPPPPPRRSPVRFPRLHRGPKRTRWRSHHRTTVCRSIPVPGRGSASIPVPGPSSIPFRRPPVWTPYRRVFGPSPTGQRGTSSGVSAADSVFASCPSGSSSGSPSPSAPSASSRSAASNQSSSSLTPFPPGRPWFGATYGTAIRSSSVSVRQLSSSCHWNPA